MSNPIAAREQARQHDGRFGAQQHSEPEPVLEPLDIDPVASARRAELFREIEARQAEVALAELKQHIASTHPTAAYVACEYEDSYYQLLDDDGRAIPTGRDNTMAVLVEMLDDSNSHGWDEFTMDRYKDDDAEALFDRANLIDEIQVINLALVPGRAQFDPEISSEAADSAVRALADMVDGFHIAGVGGGRRATDPSPCRTCRVRGIVRSLSPLPMTCTTRRRVGPTSEPRLSDRSSEDLSPVANRVVMCGGTGEYPSPEEGSVSRMRCSSGYLSLDSNGREPSVTNSAWRPPSM